MGRREIDWHENGQGNPAAGRDRRTRRIHDERRCAGEPNAQSGAGLSRPGGHAQEEKKKEEEKMSFSIKAMCKHGELVHRRKTSEAALQKAREMARTGCYNVHIVTPEGRDYASSEFGDLPRTPVAARPVEKTRHGLGPGR